jgi:exopolyphosphatase/guanosine-5'-triphosphate,3'-diphosphate pyrophosphatase
MPEIYAALDLGSNSFHLLLVRRDGHELHTLEEMKEKVQLLAGFSDGKLADDAVSRGLACLDRFAQRLKMVPRDRIRIAGTHALREARNRQTFAEQAERILGAPLSIVSGEEEARLIFNGVQHHAPAPKAGRRLVVDIGGGSTELAWGDHGRPNELISCKVGCVSLTDAHFRNASAQDIAYRSAREQVLADLAPLADRTCPPEVIGTSGTMESIQQVLAANGWGDESITREGVDELVRAITQGRWLVDAGLPGLAPERLDIFPAGVAIVAALFDVLNLSSVSYVDASLQLGLLVDDLSPADPEEDLRKNTVQLLQRRYGTDLDQAKRVGRTALRLFDHTQPWWPDPARWRDLLRWAADLHELGMTVGARHYHRHGAYLVRHSRMRGFSHLEQRQLALLVRGHRRSFPGLAFGAFEPATARQLTRLLALLRLAAIIERSHSDDDAAALTASVVGHTLSLLFPEGWLAAHPLSLRELEVETAQLASVGIALKF